MKKIIRNPLFWIFLLALSLRIYKLGEFPVGLHVDEIRVGWNALSILFTGKDDHLNLLPLYYNSFGDFRPAGIIYLTIPSILIFGRSVFAIRFSTALFGALTVFPIYLLTNILTEGRSKEKKLIGLLAGLLAAISPWNIELSRTTNEVVISTFFALFSIFFLIKSIKKDEKKYGWWSIVFIAVSYFLYHSIRLLAPIFFVIITIFFLKEIGGKIKSIVLINIFAATLLTFYFSIMGNGLARFNQTSIFRNIDVNYELQRVKSEDTPKNIFSLVFDNNAVTYSKAIISEYGKYYSPGFLVGYDAEPYRFTTPGVGILTYIEMVLVILGIIAILQKKEGFLPLLLLLASPLPAALTAEESPNMSRAFLMSPFLIILAAFGFFYLINYFRNFRKITLVTLFILLFANFSYFEWMYFHHSQIHSPYIKNYFSGSPTYRDIGAIELAQELDLLSKNYDKIIVTNFPDSIYPWYAFFTNKSPSDFNTTYSQITNERDYKNIIFSEEKCPSDNDFWRYYDKNILVIDSWECGYDSQIRGGSPVKVLSKINRPDGSEVYILLERDWTKDFPEDILNKIKQISKK